MLRIGPIYLLSGLSASLASAIFLPTIYGVGASGAIYGLIGALFGDVALHYRTTPKLKKYLFCITLSSLVGLVVGLYPLVCFVDYDGKLDEDILQLMRTRTGMISDD